MYFFFLLPFSVFHIFNTGTEYERERKCVLTLTSALIFPFDTRAELWLSRQCYLSSSLPFPTSLTPEQNTDETRSAWWDWLLRRSFLFDTRVNEPAMLSFFRFLSPSFISLTKCRWEKKVHAKMDFRLDLSFRYQSYWTMHDWTGYIIFFFLPFSVPRNFNTRRKKMQIRNIVLGEIDFILNLSFRCQS